MSNKRNFALACVLAALALHFVDFESKKVALNRIETDVKQDRHLGEVIGRYCGEIKSKDGLPLENMWIDSLERQTSSSLGPCEIHVEESFRTRYFLATHWNFYLTLTKDNRPLEAKSFSTEVPRPLALLPLFALALSLFFRIEWWSIPFTVVLEFFFLCGGNLIRATDTAVRCLRIGITTDTTFLGLSLLSLWIALVRHRRPDEITASEDAKWFVSPFFTDGFAWLGGLWNPSLYPMLGKFFYRTRQGLQRSTSFLDQQLCLATLSVYLLSIESRNVKEFFDLSLLLPRYFTFALMFFLVFSWTPVRARPFQFSLRFGDQGRYLLGFIILCLLSFAIPEIRHSSWLVKTGVTLLLCELCYPKTIQWTLSLREAGPWIAAALLVSLFPILNGETGLTDVVLTFINPKAHPYSQVFFTFAAGIALGVVTGSFSLAFFTLLSALKIHDPMVRAALLDGILAGAMLSPFSYHNYFTAVLLDIPPRELLGFRFQQLWLPLGIGAVVYTLAAVHSISILQPITFLFLCLVTLAVLLKRSEWSFGKLWQPEQNGPRSV